MSVSKKLDALPVTINTISPLLPMAAGNMIGSYSAHVHGASKTAAQCAGADGGKASTTTGKKESAAAPEPKPVAAGTAVPRKVAMPGGAIPKVPSGCASWSWGLQGACNLLGGMGL